ncbi:hypothetical protein VTI28DRAFT_3255 [Corynascus sepedonium]
MTTLSTTSAGLCCRPIRKAHQSSELIFFSPIPVLDPVHRLGNVAVNPAFRARLNPKETRSQRAQAGGFLFAPWKRRNLVQDGKDDDEPRTSLLCRRISVDITDVSEWYSCLETRGALRSKVVHAEPAWSSSRVTCSGDEAAGAFRTRALSANQKRWDLTTKTNPDWEFRALTSWQAGCGSLP